MEFSVWKNYMTGILWKIVLISFFFVERMTVLSCFLHLLLNNADLLGICLNL